MKKDWTIKKLGELSTEKMSYGTSAPSCDYDGLVRYIRITDINDDGTLNEDYVSPKSYEEKHVLKDGDIVFARTGATVGKTYCYHSSNEKYVYAGYLIRLRPDKRIVNPDYLYYTTKSKEYLDFIKNSQAAAAQPNVNAEKYSNFEIPLPPLEEQKRIVAVLDKKFSQIETLKTATEKNLQNSKDLFEVESAKILTGFKDKEVVTIESMCSAIVDCPHSTPKWTDSGKLCLRTNNFKPYNLDLTQKYYVSEKTYDERISRLKPEPGDIVFSREGGILGIACKIPENTYPCLGQRMMLLRPQPNLDTNFLLHYLNSPIMKKLIQSKVLGAAAPHINVGEVKSFPIHKLSLQEQKRIVAHLDSLSEKVHQLEKIYTKQISDCDELKQSLLAKAFEGNL